MPIGGVTVCLDTLQESSGAQRVCPGPLEQQLLQKGASELPIATMARYTNSWEELAAFTARLICSEPLLLQCMTFWVAVGHAAYLPVGVC